MKFPSQSETEASSSPSIFIAAHVAAMTLLYGVAMVVGGGFTSPPFPPDEPARQTTRVSARAGQTATNPDPDPTVLASPASNDVAPPWAFDGDGRARFTER